MNKIKFIVATLLMAGIVYAGGYAVSSLPQMSSSTNGQYLTNNGATASWGSVSGGGLNATGSSKQVAYFADGGWLKGDSQFTYDPVTKLAAIGPLLPSYYDQVSTYTGPFSVQQSNPNSGLGSLGPAIGVRIWRDGGSGAYDVGLDVDVNESSSGDNSVFGVHSILSIRDDGGTTAATSGLFAIEWCRDATCSVTTGTPPATGNPYAALEADLPTMVDSTDNDTPVIGLNVQGGGGYATRTKVYDVYAPGGNGYYVAGDGRLGIGVDTASTASTAAICVGGSGTCKYTVSFSGASSTSKFGTYSSRPTAGISGNLYTCSDSAVGSWVDDGSNWRPMVRGVVGTQPPAAAGFSAFNRSSGTVPTLADRNGTLHYATAADSAASGKINGFVESLSSATMHVEMAFNSTASEPIATVNSFADGMSVVMRESGTGKIASLDLLSNNTLTNDQSLVFQSSYWTDAATRAGGNKYSFPYTTGPLFLRLVRSGSNILYQFSSDNQNWVTVDTVATATAFTTAPDQVGFGAYLNSTADVAAGDVIHYKSGS